LKSCLSSLANLENGRLGEALCNFCGARDCKFEIRAWEDLASLVTVKGLDLRSGGLGFRSEENPIQISIYHDVA